MVLWNGKQSWQTSGQVHQEEKREDPNKQKKKWKREITTNITEIQKNHKRILRRIIYQQIQQPKEMDKFLETCSPPKMNQEGIDNLNRLVIRSETESVI